MWCVVECHLKTVNEEALAHRGLLPPPKKKHMAKRYVTPSQVIAINPLNTKTDLNCTQILSSQRAVIRFSYKNQLVDGAWGNESCFMGGGTIQNT